MDIFPIASRRFLAAIREGSPAMVFLAGSLAAFGLLRRLDGSGGVLVYRATVRRGEHLEIAVVPSGGQRTR